MIFEAHEVACRRGERLVFDGLSFRLAAGGMLLLRGPNGSGKSSLLRLCAGLLSPAAGRLTWDGTAIAEDPDGHRRRICFLGHLDPVKAALSVAENLRFWARLGGGDDAGAAAALERLGLARLAEVPARLLSAGQRRRLNLARLLAGRAPLWLLDEPTNSLDQAAVAAVAAAIAEHRAAGGMVMAATHVDLGVAAAGELVLGQGEGS